MMDMPDIAMVGTAMIVTITTVMMGIATDGNLR